MCTRSSNAGTSHGRSETIKEADILLGYIPVIRVVGMKNLHPQCVVSGYNREMLDVVAKTAVGSIVWHITSC